MNADLPHESLVRQKARGCKRELGTSPLHRVRKALTRPRSDANLLADDVDLGKLVEEQPLHLVLGWPEECVNQFLSLWYGGAPVNECLEAANGERLVILDEEAPAEVLADGIHDPHRLVVTSNRAYEMLVCERRECQGRFMVEVRRHGRARGFVACPYCGALKPKRRWDEDLLSILP